MNILRMDEGWLDACRQPERLEVRMAFEQVVNVAVPGRTLLWIGTTSCSFGPGALILDCEELPEGMREARSLTLAATGVRELLLSYGDVGGRMRRLTLGCPAQTRGCLLEKRLPVARKLMEQNAEAARCVLASKGNAASPLLASAGSGSTAKQMRSLLGEGGEELCATLAEPHPDEGALEHAFSSLVGLGVGLTPSGDDFIVGALAADRHLNPARTAADAEAIARILDGLAQRTTDVSRLYVSAAARSRFSDCVADAARALGSPFAGEDRAPELERLLAHGSTSGTDTLAGMACMLESLVNARGPKG